MGMNNATGESGAQSVAQQQQVMNQMVAQAQVQD